MWKEPGGVGGGAAGRSDGGGGAAASPVQRIMEDFQGKNIKNNKNTISPVQVFVPTLRHCDLSNDPLRVGVAHERVVCQSLAVGTLRRLDKRASNHTRQSEVSWV